MQRPSPPPAHPPLPSHAGHPPPFASPLRMPPAPAPPAPVPHPAPPRACFSRWQRRHPPERIAPAPAPPPAPAPGPVPLPPPAAPMTAGMACPLQRLGAAAAGGALRGCLRIAPKRVGRGCGEVESGGCGAGAAFKRRDEETVRREKRKMRNRLAAAKSNERRREKLEAQKKELNDLKVRLRDLTSQRSVVEMENERLRSSLREKRGEGVEEKGR